MSRFQRHTMLDLRSCPVCGKLTDEGDKTCPHCGTVFGKKPSAQKFTFEPPEPSPVQKPMVSQETFRPLTAQKPPAPKESSRPAAAPVTEKINRRDPGSTKKSAVFRLLPLLIIIIVILVVAMAGLPYLAALGDLLGKGFTPPGGSQETYTVYNNPALGFTLQYPESWTYTAAAGPGAQDITDITFTSSDKSTGLLVQVADVSGTAKPATLDDWAKGTVTVLGAGRQDFTLITNERTGLSGNPAQRYEFTWVMNSGVKMRSVVFLTVKGSRVYNIAFVTADSRAADTSEIRQKIFDSFVLTQ
jgi:uncharacterized Zn finger protein (UPF0148 family)